MSIESVALIEQNKAIKAIGDLVKAQNNMIFNMEERIKVLEDNNNKQADQLKWYAETFRN